MREILAKGTLGVIAPLLAAFTSILPQVKEWLQIISLVVGISVGVITFISIYVKIRKK